METLGILLAVSFISLCPLFDSINLNPNQPHKEWKSLAPFELLYVVSGFRLIERAIKGLLCLLTLLRWSDSLLSIWTKVRAPVLILIYAGATLLPWIRWEQKLQRSIEVIKERDPYWWKLRAEIYVYPNFSSTWWRAMIEVYAENLTMSICLTCFSLGVEILITKIIPSIVAFESLISSLLSAYRKTPPILEQIKDNKSQTLIKDIAQGIQELREGKNDNEVFTGGRQSLSSTRKRSRGSRRVSRRRQNDTNSSAPFAFTFGANETGISSDPKDPITDNPLSFNEKLYSSSVGRISATLPQHRQSSQLWNSMPNDNSDSILPNYLADEAIHRNQSGQDEWASNQCQRANKTGNFGYDMPEIPAQMETMDEFFHHKGQNNAQSQHGQHPYSVGPRPFIDYEDDEQEDDDEQEEEIEQEEEDGWDW